MSVIAHPILFWTGVAVWGGVFSLIYRHRMHAGRKLRPAPSDAPREGLISLEGTLRYDGELLRGPITGRECVAWDMQATFKSGREEFRGESKPFVLEGEGFRILVCFEPYFTCRDGSYHVSGWVREDAEFDIPRVLIPPGGYEGIFVDGDRVCVSGYFRRADTQPEADPFRREGEDAGPPIESWVVSGDMDGSWPWPPGLDRGTHRETYEFLGHVSQIALVRAFVRGMLPGIILVLASVLV